MSNWEWPQWAMLAMIIFGELANVCRCIADSRKNMDDFVKDGANRKAQWESNIMLHAFGSFLRIWILAKGRFW